MAVLFKLHNENAVLPKRGSSLSAGFDLFASEDQVIQGLLGTVMVETGVEIRIPPGYYARIAPRSGNAFRHHLCVAAGVIDRDYQGKTIKVLLYRIAPGDTVVKVGDAIAQLIIEACYEGEGREVSEMPSPIAHTHAGFGSTGNMVGSKEGETTKTDPNAGSFIARKKPVF